MPKYRIKHNYSAGNTVRPRPWVNDPRGRLHKILRSTNHTIAYKADAEPVHQLAFCDNLHPIETVYVLSRYYTVVFTLEDLSDDLI